MKQCGLSCSRGAQQEKFFSTLELEIWKSHVGAVATVVVSQSLRPEHDSESYDVVAPIFAA
jgi:hypothetical protein